MSDQPTPVPVPAPSVLSEIAQAVADLATQQKSFEGVLATKKAGLDALVAKAHDEVTRITADIHAAEVALGHMVPKIEAAVDVMKNTFVEVPARVKSAAEDVAQAIPADLLAEHNAWMKGYNIAKEDYAKARSWVSHVITGAAASTATAAIMSVVHLFL